MAKTKQSIRTIKLERLKQEMGGCCTECGNEDTRMLQFHHKDPIEESKQPTWTQVRDWSYSRIVDNYGKNCVLLCANCHLLIHWRHKNGTED